MGFHGKASFLVLKVTEGSAGGHWRSENRPYLTFRAGMSANEWIATSKQAGSLVHLTDKESPQDAAVNLKRRVPLA